MSSKSLRATVIIIYKKLPYLNYSVHGGKCSVFLYPYCIQVGALSPQPLRNWLSSITRGKHTVQATRTGWRWLGKSIAWVDPAHAWVFYKPALQHPHSHKSHLKQSGKQPTRQTKEGGRYKSLAGSQHKKQYLGDEPESRAFLQSYSSPVCLSGRLLLRSTCVQVKHTSPPEAGCNSPEKPDYKK